MSNDVLGYRACDDDHERVEALADDLGTNKSKAHERALNRGLKAHGYGPDDNHVPSYLETVINEGARATVWISVAMFIISYSTPLNLLFYSVFFALTSVALLGLSRADTSTVADLGSDVWNLLAAPDNDPDDSTEVNSE